MNRGPEYIFTDAQGKELHRQGLKDFQAKKMAEELADRFGGDVHYALASAPDAKTSCKVGDRAKSLKKSQDDEANSRKAQ